MKVGYCDSGTGYTQKVIIVDETVSGKYLLKRMPTRMQSVNGTWFSADPITGLFLRDKSEVKDIKEI